ncbi:AMP-binding protein [Chitinophaga sp. 212800010-3]|uniref:AMP-binding protein n=1 Tax=unclassified Chitinophaga TaxID=2619133 RepID=UPI002DF5D52E|nr:AMP-binding protein [Chitinophaga sp. 212800010-3]
MQYNLAERILMSVSDHDNEHQILFNNQFLKGDFICEQTGRFAGGFHTAGILPEQRVLLLLKDSPTFIYSFLALLKIGAIPVPLNPKTEPETLAYILDDSRAAAIIIDDAEQERLKTVFRQAIFIAPDKIFRESQLNDTAFLSSRPTFFYRKKPNSIAFWQYTSGTSGRPKAVQHSQDTMLINTKLFATDTLGIHQHDRIYSVPKMFFGYGLGNSFFFPLLTGASVLIDGQWPDPASVAANIIHYKPSVFFGVPKMYAALLHSPTPELTAALKEVRLFFSAGSPLPAALYEKWKAYTRHPILDGIGCTEVGHVFLTNKPGSHGAGNTGNVVEGYDLQLNYSHSEPKEKQVAGELCVKTPYPLAGYWEDPVRNNAKFRDGWYHTGDLFSKADNGTYVYHGRKDELFKSNGRWVNPSAFESRLLSSVSGIEECMLLDLPDEESLIAMLLLVVGKEDTKSAVTSYIKSNVESHCRPRDIAYLPELPRNANGKISRTVLRSQYQQYFQHKKN